MEKPILVVSNSSQQIEKCAQHGCSSPRHEDYDFCFCCLVTGKSRPEARVSCNNLRALSNADSPS
jgi:hypothetical protein